MIIVVFNQKGGVGKSTISTNLTAQSAKLGHKTLLVDLDAQGTKPYRSRYVQTSSWHFQNSQEA